MGRKIYSAGMLAVLTAVFCSAGVFAQEAELTPESYQKVLEDTASQIRWSGTPEEKEAAHRIAQTMESYGYEVEEQSFPFAESIHGKQNSKEATNVIAVKKADKNFNGDILIVSAHHDSKESTVGANDNASGTAMLLELARVMQEVESDTEIRFISFSAEEQGMKGSAYYVAGLEEAEKEHIVGDIQIDMIGHYRSSSSVVKTASGNEELLGEMLLEAAAKEGAEWTSRAESASDHASFSFAGIPAVLVAQDVAVGAENHRFIDNLAVVDAGKAVDTGKVIEQVLRNIASEDTGSLASAARQMQSLDTTVSIRDNTPILFGVEKETVDIKIGASGTLEKEDESEFGFEQAHYILNAAWFDWEALPTDFVYRKMDNLMLDRVYIRTSSLGLSDEQLAQKLTDALGEPEIFEGGSPLWGKSSMKENPSLRQYQIEEVDGEQVIEVFSNIHTNVGEDIRGYDFAKKIQEYEGEGDAADLALLETVHKIVWPQDRYIRSVISWTDGYSNMLGSCLAEDMKKSDRFDIRIDKYDFFDSNGAILDEGKLLATAVHEYGHCLTLNEGQIDVQKVSDDCGYNDIQLYKEDSYMKAFYDEFYADGKQREFYEHPEDYANEYAGTSGISEDIAESFMEFVMSGRQAETTIAARKINFFYDYPEMVEIRSYIRGNFGYPA